MTDNRRSTLEDLIELNRPIARIREDLAEYPWDSEEELVSLSAVDLQRLLERCLRGDVTAPDVETWADTIEGRDDIAFQHRQLIDLISELAAPELYGELTRQRLYEVLERTMVLSE